MAWVARVRGEAELAGVTRFVDGVVVVELVREGDRGVRQRNVGENLGWAGESLGFHRIPV